MNPQLVEDSFGHGGLGHFIRPTDWNYHNIAPKGIQPFDWSVGYDVEKELGYKLSVKNQGSSGSCGGQAIAYYAEVLKNLSKGMPVTQRSAKFIYAQVFQPGGGSFGGDLMNLMKKRGASLEALCPSYMGLDLPTESFMERSEDITEEARTDAVSAESIGYSFIFDFDIDTLAQAVRDNHGIIVAIFGQNNGTWLTDKPLHPTDPIGSMKLWGHWLYVGKAFVLGGVKYLVVLNSWGDKIGLGGWQLISEDYVNSGYLELGMVMSFGEKKYTFNKDLSYGMTDAGVYFLQKHLNADPSTAIAVSGPGSPGNETYYFGSLTKAAVIKFQQKHGITPAVGYVGPKTRGVLNQ